MGGLFHLDDLAILRKDPVGEPGQHRPAEIEDAGNFGLAHRQHHKGPVTALRGIDGRVAQPYAEHRLLALRPHPQGLIGIFGAHRHQVARRAGTTAQAADDDGLAKGRLLAGPGKAVIDFHPAFARAAAEIARHDFAGGAPVQELMVHVHQVLMHEGVVAGDELAEPPGLVGGISGCADAAASGAAAGPVPGHTKINPSRSKQG